MTLQVLELVLAFESRQSSEDTAHIPDDLDTYAEKVVTATEELCKVALGISAQADQVSCLTRPSTFSVHSIIGSQCGEYEAGGVETG